MDFYAGQQGPGQAQQFVAALQRSRPREHRRILSKLVLFERMGLRMAMEVKLVMPLRGHPGVYELRVKGTGFRFYGFTWAGASDAFKFLFLVTAEEKSGTAANEELIRQAATARADWQRRYR